jgi:hypothetical protein
MGEGLTRQSLGMSTSQFQQLQAGDNSMRMFLQLQLLVVIAVSSLLGCGVHFADVSNDSRFRPMVGTRYEVVGALNAYGIREHPGAEVDYITLIPPPGIAGSEVGFNIKIAPRSRITVLKVLKSNRWPDPDLTLEIQLTGTHMPVQAVTRIDLFRGNEGEDVAQLNPRIYRRIATGR